jgi:hypothetical protein
MKLMRLQAISRERGLQMQAFARRIVEGQTAKIVGEILGTLRSAMEPAAEMVEAGTP